jgi:pyruvate formate lyase activating enzyme
MKGKIHSIESLGTLDGPGIRSVVFFQGCALRCRYCHNPDTWNKDWGTELESEEIVRRIRRFKPYFGPQGGITLSGGEPLLQPRFAAAILKECRDEGIHTAVDTSGCVDVSALAQILPHTDLLLLDIKALTGEEYAWLTGQSNEKFLEVLKLLRRAGQELWLRYVVLPGINDSPRHWAGLKELRESLGSCVQKVELLPYHGLGIPKWEKLGLTYPLSGLQAPNPERLEQIRRELEG